MSPEQAMAVAEVDHRSDVYSLGCVVYEMIGGHAPFTGQTPRSVIVKHAVDTVPDLRTSDQAIPLYVRRAVEKALAKSPSDRFQSVGEFVEVLTSGTVVRAVHRPWRRPVLLGVALAVVVGAALVVGRWIGPTSAGEPEHPRTAVAVLPFENLSADGSYAYVAGGLHDEILAQLYKVAGITIINRASVMAYARGSVPLRRIANELEVGSVVMGSVQIFGNRLHVNVQLVDAATGAEVWAAPFDGPLDSAFAIQSDIAQRIVAAVGVTLTPGERQRIVAVPTTNSEAYQFYLQAREYLSRPGVLKQNLETAEQLYALALARDTAFALARASASA
jgi:TolB-like protein